ncbi:MAG: MFS transporter [Pseudohongiellaceae bacterium]
MNPKSRSAVLAMVLLNAYATPLMLSATNVALPAISTYFSLSAVGFSWIPMAYLMASAMFVLIFGRVSDLVGRKRIFLLGTLAVVLTSLFTAFSQSAGMLLTGRFLQGFSAAMLYATQMAIVSSVYPANQRGRVIGLVVSAVYLGLATGPLLGGLVTDWFGWRANLVLHVPLAAIVLLIGWVRVEDEWRQDDAAPIDIPGALIYATAIALLCWGVTQLPRASAYMTLTASFASIVLFARHARKATHPIWDVSLFFGNRVFTLSSLAAVIMYTATYANIVLLSLFLQQIKGLSATATGLVLMVQPMTMALLSPVAGRVSDYLEPRWVASTGMAVTAAGLWQLSILTGQSPLSAVVLALLLTGVGFSLFSSPNANAIMGSVETSHYGSASGAVATTRILGQLASMILVAMVMSLIMGERLISEENQVLLSVSISVSFSIAAVLCVAGIFLSALRGKVHQ